MGALVRHVNTATGAPGDDTMVMLMSLMLQSAEQVGRARYFAGMRLLWLLVVIGLIVGIVLLVKRVIR